MQDFIALRQAGCESRITIGPWRHADSDLMSASMHDAIDWFNQHLLGKSAAAMRKPVKLYVIGADDWRYFDDWPPRESIGERWYLQPQRGLFDRIAPDSDPDRYRYDPVDPTPSIGGPALMTSVPCSVDNTQLEGVPMYPRTPRNHWHSSGKLSDPWRLNCMFPQARQV